MENDVADLTTTNGAGRDVGSCDGDFRGCQEAGCCLSRETPGVAYGELRQPLHSEVHCQGSLAGCYNFDLTDDLHRTEPRKQRLWKHQERSLNNKNNHCVIPNNGISVGEDENALVF